MIVPYKGKVPRIANDALVAPSAIIIGDVEIESEASIFPGAVLRGDVAKIKVGRCSNIQDNVVVHGGWIYEDGEVKGTIGVEIGDYVSVTHGAILHGCKIGSVSMIGSGSIVGMGTVVLEGTKVPERSIVVGVPGRVIRETSKEEYAMIKSNALRYRELAESLIGTLF